MQRKQNDDKYYSQYEPDFKSPLSKSHSKRAASASKSSSAAHKLYLAKNQVKQQKEELKKSEELEKKEQEKKNPKEKTIFERLAQGEQRPKTSKPFVGR